MEGTGCRFSREDYSLFPLSRDFWRCHQVLPPGWLAALRHFPIHRPSLVSAGSHDGDVDLSPRAPRWDIFASRRHQPPEARGTPRAPHPADHRGSFVVFAGARCVRAPGLARVVPNAPHVLDRRPRRVQGVRRGGMGRHRVHRHARGPTSRQTRAGQPPHRRRRAQRREALLARGVDGRERRLRRAAPDAPGRRGGRHRHARARAGRQVRRLGRGAVRRTRRRPRRSVRGGGYALRRPHRRTGLDAIRHRRPRRHRARDGRAHRAVRRVRQRARGRRRVRRGDGVGQETPRRAGRQGDVVSHKGARRVQRGHARHRVEARRGRAGANELLRRGRPRPRRRRRRDERGADAVGVRRAGADV